MTSKISTSTGAVAELALWVRNLGRIDARGCLDPTLYNDCAATLEAVTAERDELKAEVKRSRVELLALKETSQKVLAAYSDKASECAALRMEVESGIRRGSVSNE